MKLKSNFTKCVAAFYLGVGLLGFHIQPAHAGQTTNKIGMVMVDIPAGTFTMGSCMQNQKSAFLGESSCSNPDRDAGTYETPQHRVSVPAFQMGKTEVTLGQFKQFIKSANRRDLVDDDFIKENSSGDDYPVVQVSWNDAQAFINWLNQVDSQGGYRLPSEAEWEYACRAGGKHSKYCGDGSIDQLGWHGGNSGKRPHPVAQKKPNGFGLYDMSGNVWEWVEDYWHDSYNGAPSDGSAWLSGRSKESRVLRGGSWDDNTNYSRAARRYSYSPDIRSNSLGFRVARTVP